MKATDLIQGNAPLGRTALEAAVNAANGRGGKSEREAFRWVAKYEQAFWEMAYAGGHV